MPYNIYGAAIENNIGALSTPQAPPPHIKVWENEKMSNYQIFFPAKWCQCCVGVT